jgi:hypothetical protein
MAERRLELDMVLALLDAGPGEDLSCLQEKVKYIFSFTYPIAIEFWLAARRLSLDAG